MIISIIAAMSENGVIGSEGAIPWDIPADRRRFRELTMGHAIVMGRKTYESIGAPLPGRRNIVLSRRPGFRAEGCMVAGSLEDALRLCPDEVELFVCGGEEIYRQALYLADMIYLTVVHREYRGDSFFPPIPPGFMETERIGLEGPISCDQVIFRRKVE